jgi:transcriptional antiterminator NusG
MFEIGRDPFADPADARHENSVDDAQMADLAGAVDSAVSDGASIEGVSAEDAIVENETVQDVTAEDATGEGSTGEGVIAEDNAVRSPRAKDDRNWFVVHTYSGYENKVKANLERRIHSMNMQDKIFRVLVPMEDEVEFKDGKRKITPKKVFPGYVLVEMTMDDQSWYVVRNTQGVTGFVGSPGPGEKPVPLPDKEVKTILKQMGIEAPKLKIDFKKGDRVKVTSGPFFDFTGVVDEITPEKERLRALISIFGRETPVELEFFQVEKV